ncbi:Com family DNA-binding transcriptional regulator [Rhizobium skierniewicense]|uniref:Com family DNA-binding transcriptional regulator n=1 Tax=Rhizobium skierniewicense TaxID=984260 RepID=UPI003D6DFB4E|nr:Com family DNA-binding transcriptional regulator [Rhizobium skierniewicense]
MENIRCGSCSALLFRAGQGAIANDIEIKCRRCGTINHLRPTEPLTDRQERQPRMTSCGSTYHRK